MEHCKDCKWWASDVRRWGDGSARESGIRVCALLSRYGEDGSLRDADEPPIMTFPDISEHMDGFLTAEDFGCVQFEAKEAK